MHVFQNQNLKDLRMAANLCKVWGVGFVKGGPYSRFGVLPPGHAAVVILVLKPKPAKWLAWRHKWEAFLLMTMFVTSYFLAVSSSVGLSVSRSSRSSTARVSWVSRCWGRDTARLLMSGVVHGKLGLVWCGAVHCGAPQYWRAAVNSTFPHCNALVTFVALL